MKQLVSIIIPCYNQSHFLDETLQSVLNQTYPNWECIIVNDGSKDLTETIAQSWTKKDNRFQYFYKDNGGLSCARNFGLKKASGHFVQFLDADDILRPEKLNASINQLKKIEENNVVITNFELFTNNSLKTEPAYCHLSLDFFNLDAILNKWDFEFSIPIHCAIFPLQLVKEIGFNQELKAKEDWYFWIQLFQKNINVSYLDVPMVLYRKHSESMTKSNQFMAKNHILVLDKIKEIIPAEVYQKFLLNQTLKYFKMTNKAHLKMVKLKNSNTYVGGLFIKKILSKVGLLSVGKKILNIIVQNFKKE